MIPGLGLQDLNFGTQRGQAWGGVSEFSNGHIYAFVGNGQTVSSLRYMRPFLGNTGPGTTEECYFLPFDMTLRRFLIKGTPGTDVGPTTTYTIRKNGVTVLTFLALATDANPYVREDNTTELDFLAGDRICVTTQHSSALAGTAPSNITFVAEIKP